MAKGGWNWKEVVVGKGGGHRTSTNAKRHLKKVVIHCKSDRGKIQTCFTKLVYNTVKIYFYICYLTIKLVKLGGFFSLLAGTPRCISYWLV